MAARTDPVEPSRDIVERAAAWHAQLADDDCTAEDWATFELWVVENPAHRLAFDRMSVIAGSVAGGGGDIGAADIDSRSVAGRMRSILPMLMLFSSLVAAVAWWGVRNPDVRAHVASETTEIGKQHGIVAASGDRLTLDSASAVDVSKDGRTVRLWRGGVMAEVRPGLAGEFVVRTPHGRARALGTRYSVRIEGDATVVAVFESRVEACAARGNPSCVSLVAGQSARLDDSGAQRLADIDPVEDGAWSKGLLIADDRSLVSAIDELNRYRRHKIGYDPRDIDGLRLSGTFPLLDGERALASIAAALPIEVERAEGRYFIRHR